MERLQEYRKVALGYLHTRATVLTEDVDELLDFSIRLILDLPSRPEGHDQYNALLGIRPVVEQRQLACRVLFKKLSDLSPSTVHYVDEMIDRSIRTLNSLPSKPSTSNVYTSLFQLDDVEEEQSQYNNVKSYSISKEGINLIHEFESYRECTYKDPGSNNGLPITGGWGSTRLNGQRLQLGKCYSREVWDKQFESDLKYFEEAVKNNVKVPITQGMYDALVSFTYNCGVGAIATSTGIKRLNARDYKGAWEALSWWNKGGNGQVLAGLVRRRKAEAKLAGFNI